MERTQSSPSLFLFLSHGILYHSSETYVVPSEISSNDEHCSSFCVFGKSVFNESLVCVVGENLGQQWGLIQGIFFVTMVLHVMFTENRVSRVTMLFDFREMFLFSLG